VSPPDWVADAVFYAVVPDRFARRPLAAPPPWSEAALEPWDAPPRLRGYKGGNLGGLTDGLPHLLELGVTTLYLTPLFESPSYHRYKPVDFFEVSPLLGGQPAFDELLAAAHRAGMRVVLDGVFNHVSWGFPPFLDVLENGERSPWRDWFVIEGWPLDPFEGSPRPANYRCWDGRRSMPELNHGHPQVQEFILTVAEHWVRRGIDGWRFDAPAEVGDADFWRRMRGRLHALNPEVYLVGEIWTDAARWLDGTQWDAVTNYPLLFALRRFIGGDRVVARHAGRGGKEPALDAPGFGRLLAASPPELQAMQLNFLDSADTARFRTVVGDDEAGVGLATLLLFTLPGTPCLLYGDEVGLEGGVDPDNRRGLPGPGAWNRACLQRHRRLIALRRRHPALRRGTFRQLYAEGSLLVFERSLGGERLVVAVNAGDALATAPLQGPLPVRLEGEGRWDAGGLALPGRTGAVFSVP
jgi:cyclomaltodextrinase / maltogenic alpha-amylase / neopullulanase